VFVLVGIPAAASVINFVVLTSAASSANSGIYSTSRMLYGLAEIGVAPKLFGKLSKHHVPANGLLFSCLCLLIGSGMLIIMPSIMAAFTVMTTIASILFIFVWSMVLISYLKFLKLKPQLHAASSYKVPGGRGMVIAPQAFFIFVLVLLTFEKDTREVLMVTPVWFIVLAVGYHFGKKNYVRHNNYDQ